jgi:hypothetical protein
MRKMMLAVILALLVSAAVAAAALAAVSSPCSGYTKPVVKKEAPAPVRKPAEPIIETYKRNVLGQKIPVYTHKAGNALTDTATKYEDQLK